MEWPDGLIGVGEQLLVGAEYHKVFLSPSLHSWGRNQVTS